VAQAVALGQADADSGPTGDFNATLMQEYIEKAIEVQHSIV